MKIFLGNDIVEIERVREVFGKYGKKFLGKTFTEPEINYSLSNLKLAPQRLAVRFAVKEAVSKALGVGINKPGWNRGINWKDVEVERDKNGAVNINLYGRAKDLEKKFNITDWSVSISHSHTDAMAVVAGYSATYSTENSSSIVS